MNALVNKTAFNVPFIAILRTVIAGNYGGVGSSFRKSSKWGVTALFVHSTTIKLGKKKGDHG